MVDGFGIIGICLIELEEMRPLGLPNFMGLKSINAAPRIAVEWSDENGSQAGVYIPNRYTSARWNSFVSKLRFFPTAFSNGEIEVSENEGGQIKALAKASDGLNLFFQGRLSDTIDTDSIFQSTQAASDFLKSATVAFSPMSAQDSFGSNEGKVRPFDGIKLKTFNWKAEALTADDVRCSVITDHFSDTQARFDSALIMRGISHEWHYLGCGNPCDIGSCGISKLTV